MCERESVCERERYKRIAGNLGVELVVSQNKINHDPIIDLR